VVDRQHASLPLARKYEKKKFGSIFGPLAVEQPAQYEALIKQGAAGQVDDEGGALRQRLLQEPQGGKFVEVSEQADLETFWPWVIATGDFDNDGFEDIFIPSGMGHLIYY
jgi:hypothetical protein